MHQRAYSLLTIKSIDEDERIIEGIATTPEADRMGDIVEPDGAEFKLPIPLLFQHDNRQPIGEVFSAKVTKDGILIKARIAKITEPGRLKERIDEAWQSIKSRLVRGLSIGFQALEFARIENPFGLRFIKWLWLELSVVTIAANADASILAIKSIAHSEQESAASGTDSEPVVRPSARGRAPVKLASAKAPMKTIADQIKEFEATRAAKAAERDGIQTKASDEQRTKDAAEKEKFDTLTQDIDGIDAELKDLRMLETENKAKAVPVAGDSIAAAAAARGSQVIQIKSNLPPGIEFTRMVMCKVKGHLFGVSPLDVAKQLYPDNPRIQLYLKAALGAGTTTDGTTYGPLVDQTNLASEFIEFLRPQTIIGRIPGLRRVPFNIRVVGQTTGASAAWVGQGAPKPLTDFNVAATTLLYTKIAAIAVITEEIARFSSPSAEGIVRDELARAVIERMDSDFINPDIAAVSGVNPASITNGIAALSSAGTSADNARTDVQNLLEQFILNNIDPTSLVIVMPNTLALALSILVNSLGQREFPDLTMRGGTLLGIPVVTSQYAASAGANGNMVIALNASDIFVADDGQVTVDMSREASLQMDTAPTNNSATPTATSLVSMFQTNSIAIRAERYINWARRRTAAVSWMDDVNWGAIGSPA